MYRLFLTIFLLVSFTVVACNTDDEFDYSSVFDEKDTVEISQDSMYCRILVVGNSLARDAFCYVPAIMEELIPNLNVRMDIMYVSGNPLKTHWYYISTRLPYFTWDVYSTQEGKWQSTNYRTSDDIVSRHKWDLVVLQEGTVNARTYEGTQPYVSHIVDYVYSFSSDTKIAYMIIPSLPDGASSLGVLTSDETWAMNVSTAKRLLDEDIVSYLVSCGTAIQNARKTPLDYYGNFGHLTYDGRHLQEGIPCLIDAYAATESIFKIMSIDSTIKNSKLKISQAWVYEKNILGRHGSVLEGSDSDYELAKECAVRSVDYPYVITLP